MSKHFLIPCQGCHHELRVRPEHLGRHVCCKICGHYFRARLEDGEDPKDHPAADRISEEGARAVQPGPSASEAESELERIRAKLARRDERYAALVKQLWSRHEKGSRLKEQLRDLRAQLERTMGQGERDAARCHELEEARAELASQLAAAKERLAGRDEELAALRTERDGVRQEARSELDRVRLHAEALQSRAAEVARLEGELAATRGEADRLRAVVQALREAPTEFAPSAPESTARELEATSARCAQLEAELLAGRSELAEQLAAARERLAGQGEELAALRAERDRLLAEGQALAAEMERGRARVGELERLLAESTERHEAAYGGLIRSFDEARERWSAERLAMQSQWEQERDAQARQADRWLAEQRERAEAEQRRWGARIEELREQSDRERETLQAVIDRLHQEIEALGRSHHAPLQLIESLTQERERVSTYRDQIRDSFAEAEQSYQAQLKQASQLLEQANQGKLLATRRGDELAGQVRELRAEIERLRREGEELRTTLVASQRAQGHQRSEAATARGPGALAATGQAPTDPAKRPEGAGRASRPTAGLDEPAKAETEQLAIDHRDVALSQLGSESDVLRQQRTAPRPRPHDARSRS